MTVIIASLFLPYTVEFNINDNNVDQDLIKDAVQKKLPLQQPHLSHQKSSSILNTINDFKTNNSSIEDFFNQSSNNSPKSGFYKHSNLSLSSFNDELQKKLSKLRSSPTAFVPKSTAKKSISKKSTLQIQLTDDDDIDDDDNFDSLYNHKVPKFGGFSKKNVLNIETNELIFKDFDIIPFEKGNGALKTAVMSNLEDYKWLGTVGIPTDRLPDQTKSLISEKLSSEYKCESVLPSDSTFQGHYKNFCKQILWPTLHYQIPDNPNSKAFEDHSWEFYKKLNQDFANKLVKIYNENDVIWIHDYHLFLLPKMIKDLIPNAKIGFFLHVSFPSSELFKCFAQREFLLQGILASNFIGFQTDEYCRHFGQTCNKLLLADISKNEIRYKGSITQIASSPVGIDSSSLFNQFHTSEQIKCWRSLIRERWPNNIKLIVGRDKFDRIRGVKQKLLSYEIFLKKNPSFIENTTLIQICLKSSTNHDTKLESEIMTIVDRINSLSPNISSSLQPVVFLHQDIDFIQYLALIAEADCFIVSSMREGMNLTCHEFIVATEEKKSPLIISEFTGSASVFNNEDVFKINPWDLNQFSQSIKNALELSNDLKLKHWNNLINIVKHQDSLNWINFNLEKINESWQNENNKEDYKIFNFNKFFKIYKSINNNKKIFILNLSNIIPSDRILKILLDLSNIPNNEIYIFSNFKKNEMERYYRILLPKIGFIAENGGLAKLSNLDSSWISLTNLNNFKKWFYNSKKLFNSFQERLPGSFFEIGQTFIKFHTESCIDKTLIDPERKSSLIGDLISHINDFDHLNDEIENPNPLLNRSDSVKSNVTTSTATEELNDLKMHATLNDDEIIYIESADISIHTINFLIDYYSNVEMFDKINNNLKVNYENEVVDISDDLIISCSRPLSPIDSPNNSTLKLNDLNLNNNSNSIKLLTIAGHRNIFFDSLFDYINEKTDLLNFENKVENIFTIGYENGNKSQGAKEYVEGLNDLFSILKNLTN